jgi:hypothetical protein
LASETLARNQNLAFFKLDFADVLDWRFEKLDESGSGLPDDILSNQKT